MASDCKNCKVAKDMIYLRSQCRACKTGGGLDRYDTEDSESIDRRNAEGFAITLRQIKQKDDLDEYELSIVFLLQLGFNLSRIAEMWGCTRANVATKFKKLRERCPHYRLLVDWTPHGGRPCISEKELDEMIAEDIFKQGEFDLGK